MLRAEDLWVERAAENGPQPVLRGISLHIPAGQITVLLGETGAGKTVLARTLSGLLPDGMRIRSGRVCFRGRALDAPDSWEALRGREIFYAPQNAAACFNPVLAMGRQLRECSRLDGAGLEELLARLGFADPRRILRSHPGALSGGENQRCLLALALASGAGTLILDEPTSEIDEAAHDDFVRVLLECQRARSLTVLLISHHLGFVRSVADSLCVMSRGELLACGGLQAVLAAPVHDYVREIASYLGAN